MSPLISPRVLSTAVKGMTVVSAAVEGPSVVVLESFVVGSCKKKQHASGLVIQRCNQFKPRAGDQHGDLAPGLYETTYGTGHSPVSGRVHGKGSRSNQNSRRHVRRSAGGIG